MTLLSLGIGILLYMTLLFLIARWGDGAGKSLLSRGWTYGISLAVYCTSWTYYGSVGRAGTGGLIFTTIYLGPLITAFFYPSFLGRLTRLKAHYSITSLADLIAVRYGKSLSLGAFATLATVVGIVPYISLQLKAIQDTVSIVIPSDQLDNQAISSGLFVPVLIFFFTVLFGLRKVNPLERHPGMILALVAECVFKLVAILLVGVLAIWMLSSESLHLPSAWERYAIEKPFLGSFSGADACLWVCYLVLSGSAVMFLPRQFQVSVVENESPVQIRAASWIFPLYLFLINLPVIPIAFAGSVILGAAAKPDYFVLLLPLRADSQWLTLVAWLGGFASATGMVMIEAMAVATMVSNNVILPMVRKRNIGSSFQKTILFSRWVAAGGLILAAWAYGGALGDRYGLVSIGMISFAATFQFVPVVLGGMFWNKGTRLGAWFGLSSGFFIWAYALFAPAIIKSFWPNHWFLTEGIGGLSWTRPASLLGLEGYDPFVSACAISLLVNLGSYVLGSLMSAPCKAGQAEVDEFMRASVEGGAADSELLGDNHAEATVPVLEKKNLVRQILARYMDAASAHRQADEFFEKLGIRGERMTVFHLSEIHAQTERLLAASLGAANAHAILEREEIFTAEERTQLSSHYAGLISQMKISPRDLLRKIDFHKERESLLKQQAAHLERQVEEKSAMLLESSKFVALGQMAGGVAHEINSPLLIISLSNEQISDMASKEEEIPRDKVKTLTARIDQTVHRISRIVQGLKSFARQDRNEPSARKLVSVEEMVEDALSLCQERFKNHGVKLEVVHQSRALKVHCNDVQMVQVILNLLNNAFDATDKLPDRWVRLETDGNSGVRIRVTDSGNGIPPEVAAKLFAPFFTTKEVGKGTGLGLSISKGIVENHRGKIEVDANHPNTSFLITLPQEAA